MFLEIQVGVSINFFIKKGVIKTDSNSTEIFYARVDEFWRKEEKYHYLDSKQHYRNVEWQRITSDNRYTWLTEGLHAEFDTFLPMGMKAAKAVKGAAVDVIFKTYSAGIKTNRDAWVYNFDQNTLTENVQGMIDTYNAEMDRWTRQENQRIDVRDFVVYDDTKIKWDMRLRQHLQRGGSVKYAENKKRVSLYRPFTKLSLFLDRALNNSVYLIPYFLPTPETVTENQLIWIKVGKEWPMFALMTNQIPDLLPQGGSQCFPFYTYDEDGTNRQENITDWALAEFRTHYNDDTITKWDIFHYNYGLLHHPTYREKYEMNLKRDLPHIPFAEDFWSFANAGAALADLHVNYESAPKYEELRYIETPGVPVDWRVERMKLAKDRTQLVYNDFLTLEGIPPEVYEYRLGNRSALEWGGGPVSRQNRQAERDCQRPNRRPMSRDILWI